MVFSLSVGMTAQAQSEAVTNNTQDLLIQKLSQVQVGLAPADPARTSVLLRLADLHAERGRQLANKELADGCSICKAGEKDRKKALTYYQEALLKLSPSSVSKVHLQMGHLYELQGQLDMAEKSYQAMLLSPVSPIEMAEANLSLAEMAFRKSDFKIALGFYQKVLATEGASSQGLTAYRQAWCHFRMGNFSSAIEQLQGILQNPKLQSRMASVRGVADMQFLEEVSRDLATMMAARGINDKDADNLYQWTPDSFKLQQVTILAREGMRLGQKEAALKVWNFVFEKQSDPKARLEAQVRIAQLNFDLKNTPAAASSYDLALSLWTAATCTATTCDDAAKGLRQFIISWNRLENAHPSSGLITAYQNYLKVFPEDEDILIWGAQAALLVNQTDVSSQNTQQAAHWINQANLLIAAKYNILKDQDQLKSTAQKLEKNLLLGIEIAEKSKDENLLQAAQNQYLELSVLKNKIFDVQYQKAYAIYQKADYVNAAELLKKLALNIDGQQQVRLQAADLSLDALALLKDDARIQKWSGEFASIFPEKKIEFHHMQQKSILTQTAKLAESSTDQALTVLATFDSAKAAPADIKVALKNKILLYEKISKISEARVAVEDLLRDTTLTAEEQEFALGRKLWFAELELDFVTALKSAEQMKLHSLSQDERILKLAFYSELAEMNPSYYYGQFLKFSNDESKKALIATQLIKTSKAPAKDFEVYKVYLKKNSELLARAALDVYASTLDPMFLEKILNELSFKGKLNQEKTVQSGSYSKSDAIVMIQKILFLRELRNIKRQLETTIDTKNQKTIATSLKARVKLLQKLDDLANRAIALGDWTAQLLSLSLVAKENSRFYQEALALPMPPGLTPEQENEYLTLISHQVAPNQTAATMAETKAKEFWSQPNSLESFKTYSALNPQWNKFITEEIQALSDEAPESQKTVWKIAATSMMTTEKSSTPPSFIELETARTHLKKNPFSVQAIENVLTLEKKSNRTRMVEYLEGRLANLNGKGLEAKEKQQ